MNERIKKLSDIAYKNHLRNNPESSFGRRTDYDKEFAELIVRECISITDELVVNSTRTSNELYADHNGALFEVKRRIESHFGVEE
jgi:hypothetical protein